MHISSVKINISFGICRFLWIRVVDAKLCTEIQRALERNYLTKSIFSACWLLIIRYPICLTCKSIWLTCKCRWKRKPIISQHLSVNNLFFSIRKNKEWIWIPWKSCQSVSHSVGRVLKLRRKDQGEDWPTEENLLLTSQYCLVLIVEG